MISLLAVMPLAHADVRAFLTSPDIQGSRAVYTAEGDLWLADTETGATRRLTTDPGVETRAHFSPDGSQIAYSANYDGGTEVYVIPAEGGIPKRITYDATGAELLGWTPDGASILFRSHCKQISSYVAKFSEFEVFSVPISGGIPTKVKVPSANFAALAPDGHTLAFVPKSSEWMNWFRYQAGEADEIWTTDLAKGTFKRLTTYEGVDTQPVWVGSQIYFISERTGIRNLFKLDPGTKKVTQITFSSNEPVRNPSSDGKKIIYEIGPKLGVYDVASGAAHTLEVHLNSDRIHARPFLYPVSAFSQIEIGPSGKRVVVVSRGHLATLPAGEGVAHVIAGGGVQRIQNAIWSPDGKKIAYTSDLSGNEELYLVDPSEGAQPKQLTKGLGGELFDPAWSPDGKYLVVGDRQNQIHLVDATTGVIKLVAKSEAGMAYDSPNGDYAISPDSKWVAFQQPVPVGLPQLYLYEIATGKTIQISDPTIGTSSPSFSQDGRWLYCLQVRDINPATDLVSGLLFADNTVRVSAFALRADQKSPFLDKNEEESETLKEDGPADGKKMVVDLDGLSDRILDMKVPAGRYAKVLAQGGRLLLLNAIAPPIIGAPIPFELNSFEIGTKSFSTLTGGVAGISLSSDGKTLLIGRGGSAQVVDAGTGPFPPTQGVVKSSATFSVNPEEEWKQIFEESWRVARDFFYDPNMHGLNWNAIHAKYSAQLPLVGSRSDLLRVQKDLISELNTGHCYVGAPGEFARRPSKIGLLGADLAWDAAEGAYKVARILRGDKWDPANGSPLAAQGLGVKEGNYLLKIDGVTLTKDQDPAAFLLGKAGAKVSITMNSKPSLTGAQAYTITTLANDADLRLKHWIEGRRKYVANASGGKIAYVYISDMQGKGAADFAHDYYANVEKPGMIFDVRGNGGGFTADQFFAQIAARQTGFFSTRNGGALRVQAWQPLGHLAAVTDEWAFSDGEWFSEFWKRLNLGPLVGHRTGGGCVGSGGGYALVDGGQIFIPNYGAFEPGAWVIEGRGTVPDYEVDQDPAALMAGKDPQLDKTIELLNAEIEKHPVTRPVHPPYPVKPRGSREGYGKG